MAGTVVRKNRDKSKPKKKATHVFHERLGSLTYYQACQLLGDEGARLIQEGSRALEVQSDRDVY